MNTKAICVYLDDSDKMEIELSWLYKTWILHSLDTDFDLVVFYNPLAEKRLNTFDNIVKHAMPPIRYANEYPFLNSHYFCLQESAHKISNYEYILKTDCDVFLTHNLKRYIPSKILIGEAGYYSVPTQKILETIKFISEFFGFHYKYYPQVGASFFGKSNEVITITANQALLTEKILDLFELHGDQVINGLDKGISSMLAGEIIVNHCFVNQHIMLYALDSLCWETTEIGSNVLHIHAWHSSQKWSKHAFFRGEYEDWVVKDEERYNHAANYCHWIATTPLEKIATYRN